MKRIAGLVAACAVLIGAVPVRAEANPQEAYQRMWVNYCVQNWEKALEVNTELLSMSLPEESRQNVEEFREWLMQADRTDMQYAGVLPGCNYNSGNFDEAAGMTTFFARDRWSGHVLNRGPSGYVWGSGNGSSSGGSSGGGNCQNPDDSAADGSRCGGRAASVRPGGN